MKNEKYIPYNLICRGHISSAAEREILEEVNAIVDSGTACEMSAADAIRILENAQGNDFYTIEYQSAIGAALNALREKTEKKG